MSKAVAPTDEKLEAQLLEQRKVKSLEKIAASLDALTIWFEEIDKEDWSSRIQYYLSEFHEIAKPVEPKDPTING
jgi:hypothetical protein